MKKTHDDDATRSVTRSSVRVAFRLLTNCGLWLIAAAIMISQLRSVTLPQLMVIPLMLLVANFGEWAIHRYPMHRRMWPTFMYDQHVKMHHRIYTHRAMEMHEPVTELQNVLFPVPVVLGSMVGVGVIASTMLPFFGRNGFFIAYATIGLYILLYELLHLAYHLPKDRFPRIVRWTAPLQRFHRDHHDVAIMHKRNFNVVAPLADLFLGTLLPDEKKPL